MEEEKALWLRLGLRHERRLVMFFNGLDWSNVSRNEIRSEDFIYRTRFGTGELSHDIHSTTR